MKALTKQGAQGVVPFDSAWKAILECASQEVFEMMAGVKLDLNSDGIAEAAGEYTAMVGLAGALCGMATVRCTQTSASKLAGLMLGGDAASNLSNAKDALGEICNMIAGNFKAKISNLADHCMLSVPTVITGEDYSMSTLDPTEGISFSLVFEGEPVWISLLIHS